MSSDEDFLSPFKKKRVDVCSQQSSKCVNHCSSDNGVLISPYSIQSWQVLLEAAEIRHYEALLSVVSSLEEDDVLNIKYHRKYRSIFTMKSKLTKLIKFQKNVGCNVTQPEEKSENSNDLKRPFTRNSLQISDTWVGKTLPSVCIFCQKKIQIHYWFKNKRTSCSML